MLECLKYLLLIGIRNAWAGVRHGHCESAVGGRHPYLHLADFGELDGVAEQVQEHLRQAPLVAFAGWKIGRQRDRERQSFSTARDSTALKTVCTTSARE